LWPTIDMATDRGTPARSNVRMAADPDLIPSAAVLCGSLRFFAAVVSRR
jgi:hypothetical protein